METPTAGNLKTRPHLELPPLHPFLAPPSPWVRRKIDLGKTAGWLPGHARAAVDYEPPTTTPILTKADWETLGDRKSEGDVGERRETLLDRRVPHIQTCELNVVLLKAGTDHGYKLYRNLWEYITKSACRPKAIRVSSS